MRIIKLTILALVCLGGVSCRASFENIEEAKQFSSADSQVNAPILAHVENKTDEVGTNTTVHTIDTAQQEPISEEKLGDDNDNGCGDNGCGDDQDNGCGDNGCGDDQDNGCGDNGCGDDQDNGCGDNGCGNDHDNGCGDHGCGNDHDNGCGDHGCGNDHDNGCGDHGCGHGDNGCNNPEPNICQGNFIGGDIRLHIDLGDGMTTIEPYRTKVPCNDIQVECQNFKVNHCLNDPNCEAFSCEYRDAYDQNWLPVNNPGSYVSITTFPANLLYGSK